MEDDVERLLVESAEQVAVLVDVLHDLVDELELAHARQVHENDARVDAVVAVVGQLAAPVVRTLGVEAVGRHGRYLLVVEVGELRPELLERRHHQYVRVQVDERVDVREAFRKEESLRCALIIII